MTSLRHAIHSKLSRAQFAAVAAACSRRCPITLSSSQSRGYSLRLGSRHTTVHRSRRDGVPSRGCWWWQEQACDVVSGQCRSDSVVSTDKVERCDAPARGHCQRAVVESNWRLQASSPELPLASTTALFARLERPLLLLPTSAVQPMRRRCCLTRFPTPRHGPDPLCLPAPPSTHQRCPPTLQRVFTDEVPPWVEKRGSACPATPLH